MNFDVDYVIPRSARKQMAKPAGDLLAGTIKENVKKAPKWFEEHSGSQNKGYKIICVGDVVTEGFIKSPELSAHLKMCVVDGKTKRKQYNIEPGQILPNKITIKNPAGTISGLASKKLKKLAESEGKFLVIVEGEEDPLVIPLILFLPEDTYIVYGQPPVTDDISGIPAGMVIISVNQNLKENYRRLLNTFETKKRKNN
ncbi:MAG: DUF359 domain-containing protein [Promethearchaeota archaeon]